METNDSNNNQSNPSRKKRDYSLFRETGLGGLNEDIWNPDLSIGENAINLINNSVILPRKNLQVPIVASYFLIPSAICNVLPILFLCGDKGSGKSLLSTIGAGFHNTEINSSVTTFAALRNYLNSQRWELIDIESGETQEKHCMMVFDNVSESTFSNDYTYLLFLNGYSRKTDRISISSGRAGENIVFHVFSPKIISSIHALYLQNRFRELERRVIPIWTKPYEQFTKTEKEELEGESLLSKLDLNFIDLTVLNRYFNEFWDFETNLIEFSLNKKQLIRLGKRKGALGESLTSARWTISLDVMAAGITTGIFDCPESAIQHFNSYWDEYSIRLKSDATVTTQILSDFVENELKTTKEVNEKFGHQLIPLEVEPQKIKALIAKCSTEGLLDISPTPQLVSEYMASLGWKLGKNKEGRTMWIPIVQ